MKGDPPEIGNPPGGSQPIVWVTLQYRMQEEISFMLSTPKYAVCCISCRLLKAKQIIPSEIEAQNHILGQHQNIFLLALNAQARSCNKLYRRLQARWPMILISIASSSNLFRVDPSFLALFFPHIDLPFYCIVVYILEFVLLCLLS